MTDIEQMLEEARRVVALSTNQTTEYKFARFIIEAFGVGFPCGWGDVFKVERPDGFVGVEIEIQGQLDREEALGVGAAIIREAFKIPEE